MYLQKEFHAIKGIKHETSHKNVTVCVCVYI